MEHMLQALMKKKKWLTNITDVSYQHSADMKVRYQGQLLSWPDCPPLLKEASNKYLSGYIHRQRPCGTQFLKTFRVTYKFGPVNQGGEDSLLL